MHVHGSWDSKAMEDNHVRSLWLVVVAVVVLMQAGRQQQLVRVPFPSKRAKREGGEKKAEAS